MKTFALALLASASAFAGHEMNSGNEYTDPINPCFHDREFHFDVFGSYVDTQGGGGSDGFGGGVGLTYFFQRYVGIGVDANLSSASDGLWTFSGNLVARYPLELGRVCLAPYLLGGGGFQTNGTNAGTLHAGGGLEWRATPAFGIYSEGRYTWAGGDDDNTRVSLGLRFVF